MQLTVRLGLGLHLVQLMRSRSAWPKPGTLRRACRHCHERAPSLFAALLFVTLLSPGRALAGKLDDVEERASRPSKGSEHGSVEDSKVDEAVEGALASGFGELVFYALTSPISFPYVLARVDDPPRRVLARLPFEPGCGLYCPGGEASIARKRVAFQAGVEGGMDTAVFPFAALDLRLSSEVGVGLTTRLSGYREKDDDKVDLSLMGISLLTYHFATMRQVQFRAGMGGRYFVGPSGSARGGFDFLYGVDIQWGKPMVTDLEFHLSHLGSAFVGQVRATVGAWFGRVQLYGGWDQTWIGGVPLGGPVLGLRGYF